MYLKRLEIVGFKSFAERIGIDFVPGVTAVVGPNGSGKSNITDAIRWVLGEQSAKSLRGAKMEDIIFAGSDSRKPLNFAEVTLVLDNEDNFLPIDYQEVSVMRRVFRSGESEFFINKQACRLRDIVDLFMDSGLGREAFSIISQGRVEEILNSKPEDRRTIFEEAAGVLKYKNRKKKAEIKLTETEENLNRVNDIIHELQSQIEPLKVQASIAQDYLQKKEELENIEVALTVYEIEELHGKWEKLSAQLEEHKDAEMRLSSSLQAKEAKVEEIRHHMQALDESINELQDVLLSTSEELEKLEGRKEVLKERKKNAKQNKDQLQRAINELTEKTTELASQKKVQEEIVNRFVGEGTSLKRSLQEKQKLLEQYSENIDVKIESLKSDYIELLNKQASSKNELQNTEQQMIQLEKRSERLEKENEKYLWERREIAQRKAEIRESLTSISEKLNEQIRIYKEKQQELEKLRTEYQKKETTLYQAYQFLQKTKSRKDTLEEMEEEYAGFYQGVKEVLKARDGKLPGIAGAVAELVQVPKEYEPAIETALAGAMQNVVVDTEESGRRAIQYLKQHGFGRATFLPLNVIRGKSPSYDQKQAITQHSSYIGLASELIDYDEKYGEIIRNLLGTVVVASDLKGATDMAKSVHYRLRIVTLDGDVVNPGGSMTGGSVRKQSSSLLSRKGELEDLKTKLADMEEKTSRIEEIVKSLKNKIRIREQNLEVLRKEGEELRIHEESIKGNLREAEIEEKNINEKLTIYDLDKSQYTEELNDLSRRRTELESSLQQYREDITILDGEISSLNEQRQTQITSKETIGKEINDLKIQLAAKNEQIEHAKEKLQGILEELEELNSKKTENVHALEALSLEVSDSSSGEEHLEEEANKKLFDKNKTIKLISERREERLNLQNSLEDYELEIKEQKRQHRGMSVSLKDEEVKLNRLDVELENLLSHLREEYLLTYEGAKEEYPLTVPPEDARKRVKLIKLAIDDLGTVNLGAIDEYERVSERYEFLLQQKNDLEEAKNTLYQVIDEMDEEMKKRFSQTFDGVRSHFEFVFQALFGGGRADLRLTDPDDLLTTGIEIMAQPPGKKLQNLGLLSGGERALTAIALLFSILKVRPVPFCILDEVEAALDEANVYRFSQYLKTYSQETQFIVITHRKGTMEEADVLYGVTMQESGVSKLVSVRLEESNEILQS